jgi:hypothetical protein
MGGEGLAARAVLCSLLYAVSACSLLYDTGDFEGVSDGAGLGNFDAAATPDGAAGIDASPPGFDAPAIPDATPVPDAIPVPDAAAMPDADPMVDAGPGPLTLSGIAPAQVNEGEGSNAASPASAVLISGSNIAVDAVVTASRPDVTVVDTLVGADGNSLAVSLRIPVIAGLPASSTEDLTLTVTQSSGVETIDLVIQGLDELVIDAVTFTPTSTLYSTIAIAQPVRMLGTEPVRLVATGDITVNGAISIDAPAAPVGEPGPGGCAGGAPGVAGDCSGGGPGLAGPALGSGGGGAGCGEDGEVGEDGDNTGGTAGSATCDLFFNALGASNSGNGGGGGGDSTSGVGGVGGGGGGGLELTAGGAIYLDASVTADGGDGADGTGTACTDHGGGGGGGAGGLIFMRATLINRLSGVVRAARGRGGEGGGSGSACAAGGDGGEGRIRLDAATLVTPVGGDGAMVRGPMLAPPTPVVMRAGTISVQFTGEPDTIFNVTIDGGGAHLALTDLLGVGTTDVDVVPGIHNLCSIVIPLGGDWESCRRIAVVP